MRSSSIRVFFWLGLVAAVSTPARARSRHHSAENPLYGLAQEALVSAPTDQETCFSPDEPCDIKLKKFVASAHDSIEMAIYDINLDGLVKELLSQSRKIKVRILVDERQSKGRHSKVRALIEAGAEVKFGNQRGIMHNKFTIVDHKMVQLGSFNYTHHASQSNNENQLYVATPKVVDRYIKRFDRIWTDAKPARF